MIREFSFSYQGTRTNDTGTHYGFVTDLRKMRSRVGRMRNPMLGCMRDIEGNTKEELWEAVQNYVMEYPGRHDATIIVAGYTHYILNTRRLLEAVRESKQKGAKNV